MFARLSSSGNTVGVVGAGPLARYSPSNSSARPRAWPHPQVDITTARISPEGRAGCNIARASALVHSGSNLHCHTIPREVSLEIEGYAVHYQDSYAKLV